MKTAPNAGTSEYLVLLIELPYIRFMFGSDNASSADNQQERLLVSDFSYMPAEIAWYIVGFTDGEGSFNISFKRELSYGIGWKVALSFNISQRDEEVLRLIQSWLRCGTIRFRKDGVGYLEVRSLLPLKEVIIPFFNQFPLKSKKHRDFELFKSIASLVFEKKHLTYSGMKSLLDLRETMNGGGKRKFSAAEILSSFQEESSTTRRAAVFIAEDIVWSVWRHTECDRNDHI